MNFNLHFCELHSNNSINDKNNLLKTFIPKCYKVKRILISFNCFSEYRSAPVRELLSNNSLFVSQLYEDKSLALRARDLIFFTTDLQTMNYYSTIHC